MEGPIPTSIITADPIQWHCVFVLVRYVRCGMQQSWVRGEVQHGPANQETLRQVLAQHLVSIVQSATAALGSAPL